MNTEIADNMKDTIAFFVARYNDDKEAAKVILGIYGENPTEEEAKAVQGKVVDMLLMMTDFALSQIKMMAMIVGVDTDKFLRTLGTQMAVMTEDGR